MTAQRSGPLRAFPRLVSALIGVVIACIVNAADPAIGQATSVSCAYSGSNHKVKIILTGDATAAIRRGVDDRIRVNDVWCDRAATVFNTDTIVILAGAGTQTVLVHLDYGGFKPGFTNEAGTSDEIEISVSLGGGSDSVYIYGSGVADSVTVGKSSGFAVKGALNLNATETSGVDADLTLIVGVEEVVLLGKEDNDVISGAGGAGTGDPADFTLKISGSAGNDSLTGGTGADSIIDTQGADVLKGGGGPDFLNAVDGVADDQLFGGSGADTCEADPGDALTSC